MNMSVQVATSSTDFKWKQNEKLRKFVYLLYWQLPSSVASIFLNNLSTCFIQRISFQCSEVFCTEHTIYTDSHPIARYEAGNTAWNNTLASMRMKIIREQRGNGIFSVRVLFWPISAEQSDVQHIVVCQKLFVYCPIIFCVRSRRGKARFPTQYHERLRLLKFESGGTKI